MNHLLSFLFPILYPQLNRKLRQLAAAVGHNPNNNDNMPDNIPHNEEIALIDAALSYIDEQKAANDKLIADLGTLPGENAELKQLKERYEAENAERDAKFAELRAKIAGPAPEPEPEPEQPTDPEPEPTFPDPDSAEEGSAAV